MHAWGLLFVAIVAEVIATTALKASAGFTRLWPALLVVAGYGLAFYCFALALRSLPVGIAYAVWAGLGIVLMAAIGWLLFAEKLDGWAWLGIGLIVSGVAVLNLFSKSAAQ